MVNKEFLKMVRDISLQLNVPKSKYNEFGKFKYRSCEDIFTAFKKLVSEKKYNVVLTCNDEIVLIGNRFYIKSVATLTDGENSVSNEGYAREEEVKKGMDGAQITGTASTYARKYALNGLFLLDDADDPDDPDTTRKTKQSDNYRKDIPNLKTINELTEYWNSHTDFQLDKEFTELMSKRKKELLNGTQAK